MSSISPHRWILIIIALGFTVGIGFMTFIVANGFSYFSHESESCANCHIMQDTYQSWSTSRHRLAARCQDCHLPYDLLGGLYEKASQGLRHAYVFTFLPQDHSLKITENGYAIALKNCVRCHEQIFTSGSQAHNVETPTCLTCHHDIGHATHP